MITDSFSRINRAKGGIMTKRFKYTVILGFIICCIVIFAVVLAVNLKTASDSRALLEESIKSQLISISAAAREIIDPEKLDGWNSNEDIENDLDYAETLAQLRKLAKSVGADYIYVLKQYGDAHYFVLDTDEEDEEVFIEYEVYEVHQRAFRGTESAGVRNVVDEYGSFNSGALPIYYNDKIIAIVSTDIEDVLFMENLESTRQNTILLILVLLLVVAVISLLVVRMLRIMQTMTDELEHIAKHDKLTKLPNREYLMSHLQTITNPGRKKGSNSFALVFIDVDNFKTVNDSAGHDAGDALLEGIADYLQSSHEELRAFRPTAGKLNVAARIGGDEFLLVVEGVDTDEAAAEFCNELIVNFPLKIVNPHIEKYGVGLSVGAALYPTHSRDYNVLIKYSDIAMYHAKKNGKNNYKIYNDELAPKDEK